MIKSNGVGMSLIVKSVAAILVIPITIFGIYVILHGHLTPGGGFPGGAILATLIALFLVAYGSDIGKKIDKRQVYSIFESIGLIAFVVLGLAGITQTFGFNILANGGFIFGDSVMYGSNPGSFNTGGLIPLFNIAIGLEVFAALSLITIIMFFSSGDDCND